MSQIARHSVALISLTVALSSLAYNTWRNEQSEANRNIRTAGIELLLKLGELDRTVFNLHFGGDDDRTNPHEGWAYVLTIRDLGTLTSSSTQDSSAELATVWEAHFAELGRDKKANDLISEAIESTRADVLEVLEKLD